MRRVKGKLCRTQKGRFTRCKGGASKASKGGKRKCKYGKSKTTGRCLKRPRSCR
jgi:hypothetical protein